MTTENSTNATGNVLLRKLNALIDAELNPEQVSMELPAGPNSQDYTRPEFSSLSFLADFDQVYPEVGYGQSAHSYFRYKDGRDQGYLCSVVPDQSGQGYTTQDSLWGCGFTYLGGVLFDLGCHCSEIP